MIDYIERATEVLGVVEQLVLEADELGNTVSEQYDYWVKSDNPEAWLDSSVALILGVE